MALMDTSEGTPGGGTQEFTVIPSGPLAGWRLETDATAGGNMRLLRSPDGTKTLYARPGEFESGIEGAQVIPGFGTVFSPEQASAFGAKYTADNKLFGFVPDDSRLLVGTAMGIAGAGIGAHSGLFGGGAGGVSDLSYLSEAGPEFGAGGTNWLGSGVDASWGVNQVPLDSFGNQMTSGEPWAMEEGLGSVGANTYTAGGQLLPAGTSGGGTSSIPDWLKSAFPNATWGSLLTGGAKGILDYLAADKMSDVNQANFDRVWGAGAPSRERFEGSFAPGFMSPDLTAALPVAAETRARALSTGGNPADNPGMQAEIDRYLIGNYILPANESYRRTNLAGGSLGFSEAQNFAQNQTTLAGAPYNAIATGVGAALNPSPSLEDLLKRYNINLGRAPA